MHPHFLPTRRSNAQILPGDEIVLLSTRQIRKLVDQAHPEMEPTFTPGLSGLLQALGPCPAPATLRAGVTEPDQGHYWVALELCHWRIEPGGLRWMAHGEALALSNDESNLLFEELQAIFSDSPAQLRRSAAGEFSLLCDAALAKPHAVYPDQLLGAEMKPHLPHLTLWQRWLNEVQMQLASSPLNQKRQQTGQLAINSLWFWGAEAIDIAGAPLALHYDGRDPILLARAAQVAGSGAPVRLRDWRDVDVEALSSEFNRLPRSTRLLSDGGYLYERAPAPGFLTRMARWFGARA